MVCSHADGFVYGLFNIFICNSLYATSRAPFLYWLDEAKKRFEAASPAGMSDIVSSVERQARMFSNCSNLQ